MNVTIDDMSPQIQYSGAWQNDFRSNSDIDRYFGNSFHGTFTDGDSARFTFNGTDIYVYGDNKKDRGVYSVSIDGQTGGGLLNAQTTNDAYQAVLFEAHNLSPDREHTVVLTSKVNLTTPLSSYSYTTAVWFTIDYMVVTLPGNDVVTTVYDDADDVFAYEDWPGTAQQAAFQYYDNTFHLTYMAGAKMTFSFNGSSVQLLAGTNSDHGPYMVQLDNQRAEIYDGTTPFLCVNNSLYFASGLTEGPHTLTLTNVGKNETQGVDFDWAVVNSTRSTTTTSSAAPSGSSSSSSSSTPSVSSTDETPTTIGNPHLDQDQGPGGVLPAPHGSEKSSNNLGPLLGGVAGGLVAALAFWFYRRRKIRRESNEKPGNRVDLNDDEECHGRAVNPFVYSVAGTRGSEPDEVDPHRGYLSTHFQSASASSFGHSPYGEEVTPNPIRVDERPSYFSSSIPPPPSSHSAYPQTEDGRLVDLDHSEPLPSPPSQLPYTDAYSGMSLSTHPESLPKSPAMSLPYTATPPTTMRGSWHERMTVDGREVDMGPASPISEERAGRAPPNYQQATQPLPGQSPLRGR